MQLKRMEMEAHSFPPERARQLTLKVKEYKADLAKLRSDARAAASQVQLSLSSDAHAHARAVWPLRQAGPLSGINGTFILPACPVPPAAFTAAQGPHSQLRGYWMQESGGAAARAELGLGGDYSTSSAGQRERMLGATGKLQQTGDRIAQGRQQLLETEVSASGPDVAQQSEQLLLVGQQRSCS